MIRASFLFACGSALGVVAALAMAEPPRGGEGATVITGSTVRYLSLPQNDTTEVQLVARRVSVPGVTVSRALSEQPVRPFLAEVKIDSMTTFVDPNVDLRRPDGTGGIDQDHDLVKAQRLWRSLHGGTPATVIWGSQARQPRPDQVIEPAMILIKPDLPGSAPAPGKGPMPSVPAPPPKATNPLMAQAN